MRFKAGFVNAPENRSMDRVNSSLRPSNKPKEKIATETPNRGMIYLRRHIGG
jgi:hypothetical protein